MVSRSFRSTPSSLLFLRLAPSSSLTLSPLRPLWVLKQTSTLTGSNIDPLEAAKPSAQDDNNNNQDESTKTRKDSVIMSSDGSFEVPLDEEMKK